MLALMQAYCLDSENEPSANVCDALNEFQKASRPKKTGK
ncbi:hypothetical protein C4K40_0915 [Pseudomonas sp. CMR5c]|nr:hypothetical protein C4K40_0915 [Pseudomonas sp. CMR5c]